MEKNEFAKMVSQRTKEIAKKIVILVSGFPQKTEYFVIGKQLLRSATSTAANYRAVVRARSKKEFYSKLSITIEECDETLFWLEILSETNLINIEKIKPIMDETTEILKILSKSRKTMSSNNE
ncbi:MAG: four helix bundle protein [Saprospiraceae bacterium]